MRNTLVWLVLLTVGTSQFIAGCATQRCIEEYSTMPINQAIRQDGELLQELVERREAAAQALGELAEGSSEREDITFSVQAWELAISLVVQLQNLSRREEFHAELEETRELTSNIRCEARSWIDREGHEVRTSNGQEMLTYARQLEEVFGIRGRPSDSQLTAICEGREIYMGPVEEEVDVPATDEGTGPEDRAHEGADDEDESAQEEASSAVEELLGED